jgi:putative hydrolase
VDQSNLDFVVPRISEIAKALNKVMNIKVVPGVEITHVPPVYISELSIKARSLGAKIVIVHGETIVEPVASETDHYAVLADIDILAHPGLIAPDDVTIAAQRGICLEISARKGHSLTNGYVAKLALEMGAKLVLDTDSHEPSDLITMEHALAVIRGAGLDADYAQIMFSNSDQIVQRTA